MEALRNDNVFYQKCVRLTKSIEHLKARINNEEANLFLKKIMLWGMMISSKYFIYFR